ncbi:MAG: class I SAM-dependent methyltransferase [Gammaproteobacteria bacterium]
MPKKNEYQRFADLTFDDFRRMAGDDSLSRYEKIGFPDDYRQDTEEFIFQDIITKLPQLQRRKAIALDIGPGCSGLPRLLINHLADNEQHGIFVDSAEMLAQLPDQPFLEKVAAYYPHCDDLFEKYKGRIDAIICYSVLQYVFVESNTWTFLDKSMSLLAPGGAMLIGDLPNVSKRKRFFSSTAGLEYHRKFTGSSGRPEVEFNRLESEHIDDSVIFAIIARARAAGFDGYVMPQDPRLSMANRREDIVITRP